MSVRALTVRAAHHLIIQTLLLIIQTHPLVIRVIDHLILFFENLLILRFYVSTSDMFCVFPSLSWTFLFLWAPGLRPADSLSSIAFPIDIINVSVSSLFTLCVQVKYCTPGHVAFFRCYFKTGGLG